MSVHLERLVREWRDAERKRTAVLNDARLGGVPIEEVMRVNQRRSNARDALLKYAEEEMG